MRIFSQNHIRVLSIKAFFDEKSCTKIKETTNLLQYESQHFRCKVRLSVTQSEADRPWSIGLIQACDYMYLENKYGPVGSSFWEFHPIKCERHKMVNDSDGRQYPFYSLLNSKFEIGKGKVNESNISLFYEDHFYPTVAWELPYCDDAQLTDIIRKQDFWVWLVAISRSPHHSPSTNNIDFEFDEVNILKTIRWRYNLHMTFSPSESVGQRVDSINDHQKNLPHILEFNKSPPLSAMCAPHCNAAQSLIWYPSSRQSIAKLLVPPKQIIVPWDEWVQDMLPETESKIVKPKYCKVIDSKVNHKDEVPNSRCVLPNNSLTPNNSSLFGFLNRQQIRIKNEA